MRDQQRRRVPAVDHVHHQLLHLGARDGVQGRERLVGQQQLRLARQGARQGHALCHAARQLRGVERAAAAQAHGLQRLLHALAAGLLLQLRLAREVQAEAHVAPRIQPGQQAGLLEHEARARVRRGQRLAEELELAPAPGAAVRRLQAAEHAQQRGLAAAAAAEQADDLARGNAQGDVLEHGLAGRIAKARAACLQHGRGSVRGESFRLGHELVVARAAPASAPCSCVTLGVTMGMKAASRQRRANPSGWSR